MGLPSETAEDESARFALLLKLATLASNVFSFGLVGEHEDEWEFQDIVVSPKFKELSIAGTLCASIMKPTKSFLPWGSLLRRTCTNLLESFNPKATTVDAYFEDAPVLENPLLGEVELKFCHQIFYGCYRYNKLLKLFVTSFVYKVPATALRSEQSLYMILAYLLFFRQGQLAVTYSGRSLNILCHSVSFCDTLRHTSIDEAGWCGYWESSQIRQLWLWIPSSHLCLVASQQKMCCRRCDQRKVIMILCWRMHDYITLTSSCEDFRDYAMDKEELQRWVMEEWLKHYDPSYLEKESF